MKKMLTQERFCKKERIQNHLRITISVHLKETMREMFQVQLLGDYRTRYRFSFY